MLQGSDRSKVNTLISSGWLQNCFADFVLLKNITVNRKCNVRQLCLKRTRAAYSHSNGSFQKETRSHTDNSVVW